MAFPDNNANNAKLLSFLFALIALIVLLLAASKTTTTTKDIENEDEKNGARIQRSDASVLLKNVPQNDDMRKKTYCAKVANVGEWFFGETACEYAKMEMDFAHSFDACDEGDEATWWFERRRRRARRKEAKAWVPDEGLMDACQFFRFASATIATRSGSFSSSTSVAIDTDSTATAVEVAKEAREEE